jgi:hypothetical protein
MMPPAPDVMFLAPERFALLAVPSLFAVLYLLRQRRRRSYVVRFTDPELIETVAPRRMSHRVALSPRGKRLTSSSRSCQPVCG